MKIMKLKKTNQGKYYYSEGKGEAIVFLHGFPDCPENYFNQINFFSSNGYEVICPYMPGYHEEDKKLESYGTDTIALEVIKFIKELKDQPINLVGHDWGASTAYLIAAIEPKMIKSLVALSVPHGNGLINAILSDGDQQRKSWYMFFFQLEIADLSVPLNNFEFIDRLWREWSPDWPAYKDFAQNTIDALAKSGVLNNALGYYRSTFQNTLEGTKLNKEQLVKRDSKILCPSLYLHGENDGCIESNLTEGMENNFKDLEIDILENCGHFLHLEKPEIVNKKILKFLSRG